MPLSSTANDRVEWALGELKQVLADRAEDPHARAALQTLRDAFCAVHSRASLDPLTGLMNRTSFDQALARVLGRTGLDRPRAALMFMDLDGFKRVNDERGHRIGDHLLQIVAARVVGCVREHDLLARYGGDEFVVLLDELASTEVVHAIATRIIASLSAPFRLQGLRLRLSVSIGVALFPEHGGSAEQLLRRADAAMYRAKREGGRRYLVCSPASDDQAGSYARLDISQRSTAATDIPLRRA